MTSPRPFARAEAAFTLIELMVVIAIIAAIAAIAIPNLLEGRREAERARAVAQVKAIAAAEEQFFRKNGRYTWQEELVRDKLISLDLLTGVPDAVTALGINIIGAVGVRGEYLYVIDFASGDATYSTYRVHAIPAAWRGGGSGGGGTRRVGFRALPGAPQRVAQAGSPSPRAPVRPHGLGGKAGPGGVGLAPLRRLAFQASTSSQRDPGGGLGTTSTYAGPTFPLADPTYSGPSHVYYQYESLTNEWTAYDLAYGRVYPMG